MRVLPGSLSDATRALDAGEVACSCGSGHLRRWGWARPRLVRSGDRRLRLRPRRGRCAACGRTHVLLPDLCLCRRFDSVDVIGTALAASRRGRGARRIAAGLGLPVSTVGDWLRAFRRRGSPWPADADAPQFRWRLVAVRSSGLLLAPPSRPAALRRR
ncbi:MAG TPA: hypothetical protein VLR26_16530 [Frankiaceae bacterium]|nr:hypothetical protein [Frankiaceae bacterium]